MCSMSADDDDRAILDALSAAYPAMVGVDDVCALDGMCHADEAIHRLGEDGRTNLAARRSRPERVMR
jgi:hypothetical protein